MNARRAHLGTAMLLVLAAPFGCRGVLGVEERELARPDCETYCSLLEQVCSADLDRQYATKDLCVAYCDQVFADSTGSLDDQNRDTLGCRQRLLELQGDAVDCTEAGPLSRGGGCGAPCANHCRAAGLICAVDEEECLQACDDVNLSRCSDYSAGASSHPLGSSLECRAYHLPFAVKNAKKHCMHVQGEGPCSGVSVCESTVPVSP